MMDLLPDQQPHLNIMIREVVKTSVVDEDPPFFVVGGLYKTPPI